ncbi:MAG TPA: HDOD domain-containing protein, partial [Longimicrobiaceae bacterium]
RPAEVALPPAAEMLDAWRQEVARIALELRERYPLPDDQRAGAERLLVRLAVDVEMVIRQPSAAAREAYAVASDPACEVPALLRVVERDPTLARALLRHASSAAVGLPTPPASVDDAVRRLGAKGVQIAMLAGMAESLLSRPAALYSPMAPHVWAHMVRTGPRARALARAFDVAPQEAFTIGLLHDVGKLVLFDLAAALREEFQREVRLPPQLVAEALRLLHEPLGGMALLRWGVDPRAAWAVANHHRGVPGAAPDRRSEVVFVAERLDVAVTSGRPVALDEWAAEGRLTVERARMEAAVERARAA